VLARAAGTLTRVVGWPPRLDRVEAGITVRLAAAPQVACTNRENLIAGASACRMVGWTCLRRSADLKPDRSVSRYRSGFSTGEYSSAADQFTAPLPLSS
jgi:hypothetical protein